MNVNQRIIVDCDGVLLNWRSTFIDWLNKFNLLKADDPSEYDMSKLIKIPGVMINDGDLKNFSLMLSNLFNQSYMLKKLPPIEGSVEAIQKLHKSGYKITVVSSYTTDFEAMKSREENLINVFGPVFQEIVSLPLHASKREWLSHQDKNSIFIEDAPKNIEDAIDVDFNPRNCFLILKPWNRNHILKHPYHVSNWNSISEYYI